MWDHIVIAGACAGLSLVALVVVLRCFLPDASGRIAVGILEDWRTRPGFPAMSPEAQERVLRRESSAIRLSVWGSLVGFVPVATFSACSAALGEQTLARVGLTLAALAAAVGIGILPAVVFRGANRPSPGPLRCCRVTRFLAALNAAASVLAASLLVFALEASAATSFVAAAGALVALGCFLGGLWISRLADAEAALDPWSASQRLRWARRSWWWSLLATIFTTLGIGAVAHRDGDVTVFIAGLIWSLTVLIVFGVATRRSATDEALAAAAVNEVGRPTAT